MNGCSNCRYCKCYSGDYWTPDYYECEGFERDLDIKLTDEEVDTLLTRVWENREEWKYNEDPICPAYEEDMTPPDYEYWEQYAWEENHYDKFKDYDD